MSQTPINKFIRDKTYLYGMHTIEDRAIPGIDGAKPVHKRLALAAREANMLPTRAPVKSARLVGDTMGKYHPHGDTAIYDALVSLVGQRYPLFEGHGNFGSLSDRPAAQRYTETRLSPFGLEHLANLDVVPSVPNYNGQESENVSLNAVLPILLLNGTMGIAMGLRSSTPPHNLGEIVDACIRVLENPDTTARELVLEGVVLGPDYPEGGCLTSSKEDLIALYENGTGSLSYTCAYEHETLPSGSVALVTTSKAPELNYAGGGSSLIAKCEQWANERRIGLFNEDAVNTPATPQTFRFVIELSDPHSVAKLLAPALRTRVSYNFAVIDRQGDELVPCVAIGLVDIIKKFLEFRATCEQAVLNRDLAAVRKEIAKVDARLYATNNLDQIVAILTDKQVKDRKDLVAKIVVQTGLSEEQAEYLCSLQVASLARFSAKQQKETRSKLKAEKRRIKADLRDIPGVIKRSLLSLKEKYADTRRTQIGFKSPKLPSFSGTQSIVIAGPDGRPKVLHKPSTSMSNLPSRKEAQPADALITTCGDVYGLVGPDSTVTQLSAGASQSPVQPTVGIAGKPGILVVVTKDGHYAAVRFPHNRTEYRAGKFGNIMFAGSESEDGTLVVVYSDTGDWRRIGVIPLSELKVTRPGVKGSRLPKLPRKKGGASVLECFLVPSDGSLEAAGGHRLAGSQEVEVLRERARTYYVLGESTLGLTSEKLVLGSAASLRRKLDAMVRTWVL